MQHKSCINLGHNYLIFVSPQVWLLPVCCTQSKPSLDKQTEEHNNCGFIITASLQTRHDDAKNVLLYFHGEMTF